MKRFSTRLVARLRASLLAVFDLPQGIGATIVSWKRPAVSFVLSPGVTYPAALAATAWASVLALRGSASSSALLALVAAAAWWTGHRRSQALARTAAEQGQLSGLHMATIEALASAIDAKDKTSAAHIRRVQEFARALAREIHLDEEEVQAIATAALLHDVGKLAVPEHILSKPGPLTDEEFERIKIHPQVGFEIIEHVPFPCPVAPLVLCHHERWDGSGYPLGLRADDIPLGARVLAVADYFDSVMRDRPYNKAVSSETATLTLREESGRALDPHLVSAFLGMLATRPLAGVVAAEDLRQAARDAGDDSSVAELVAALDRPRTPATTRPLPSDCVDATRDLVHEPSWRDAITHQVSQHCAAFFDRHQARWAMDTSQGLYDSWRQQLAADEARSAGQQRHHADGRIGRVTVKIGGRSYRLISIGCYQRCDVSTTRFGKAAEYRITPAI